MSIFGRNHQHNKRHYAAGVALAALTIVYSAPALAQDQAPTKADTTAADQGEQRDELVITGSRVARTGYRAPTPVTVISQQEIQNQSPTNNLADFVNQLPSVAGSTRPANSRLAISSGLAGINALNLRNIGDIRTLVLLDGRRSVGSSVTGLVDINTFPQSLVKSVEVVTGGASAAYGSDAVAGVVNFVLDKKYRGLKVSLDSGITEYGDGGNYSLNAAAGFSFAGGRGHVLLSGEYAHRDGIFQVDRDWNQLGFRTTNNPTFTNSNGQPQNIVVFNTGTSNALPGGIINASAGGVANRLRGTYFGQGGVVRQFNYGTINTNSLTTGGDWELADNSRNIGLDASDDRVGGFGRISYEVAPWIELYVEGSYNKQKSLFNAGPQLSTAISLARDNAYLINALGATALTGITSVTLGTTAVDLPFRKNNNERNVQRYVFGGEGDFPLFGKRALWSAYVQYGETNTREQLRDIMNTARINSATDAVFAPAGNALGVPAGTIVCRSTLTAPTNGCQPLNRLGVGVVSQAAIGYVLGDPYRDQKLQQIVSGVNLSTTPFATWAGDVSIAIGGEYRREEVSGSVPLEFQTGWSVGNFLPTFGSYNVKEAYIETVVPLGLGVEFNGAARATDYSLSGYVTTWKAGLTWQPIPDIRIRATQSRDIRAPNLNELFQAGTSRTNTLIDRRDPNNVRQGVTFRETTTGNLNLRPEVADSTSVGGVIQPRFLPGLVFSVDWFQIKLEGAIGQFFAQDIIDRCAEGRLEFCAAFNADPTGDRELVFRSSPFNFARINTSGIDFDMRYRVPLAGLFPRSNSSLALHGLATRYLTNVVNSGVAGVIPVDTVGQNGGAGTPSWIYRVSLTYDDPTFSLTSTIRGISAGTFSNSFIECQTTCPVNRSAALVGQFPTIDRNRVSGLTYVDLNLTAKIGSSPLGDMQVFANITNVFDRDPALLPEGGLSANSTYSDLLGRAFRIGVRFQTR